MIEKIICYLLGHNIINRPVKVEIHEGQSKLIIPSSEICLTCNKKLSRKLLDYEIPFFIKGLAIYEIEE